MKLRRPMSGEAFGRGAGYNVMQQDPGLKRSVIDLGSDMSLRLASVCLIGEKYTSFS